MDEYSEDQHADDQYDDGSPQKRLAKAVETSYRQLSPYRDMIVKLVKEYAGPMYGIQSTGSSELRRVKHINLLKQAVTAYMTILASSRPRALITTKRQDLKPFAKHYQVAVNRLLKDIEIENVIAQWVRDAFFWVGIVKVHMADTGELVEEGDLLMDPGKPFASNIPLDDFFWDINAKKFSECRFAGDIYRMPVETLKNSDQYSGKILEDLQADSKYGVGEDRLEDIATGNEIDDDELEPMCNVADIWLPREGVVRTYVVSKSGQELCLKGDPIAEYKWRGRELGPYKILSFDDVSENVLPASTAGDLYELDRLINNLFRKNASKASRAKENPVYTPSGQQSAERLKNASDGEWVAVNDPREVNVVQSGGINTALHGFMINAMDQFDRMAGNLQAMLGLGPSSDTVGQDKLIHGASSRREGHLQNRVVAATTKLIGDLGYLLWEDGFTTLTERVDLESVPGISYDATWTPGDREGQFDDYDFDVDVYSMQYQSPSDRVAMINELLGTIYIPLQQMIQQQGGTIDFAKLTEMHSEMLNLPRLKEVVLFNMPPAPPAAMGDGGPKKSPVSNRTYTRKNISEDSGKSEADKWMQEQS